MAEKPYADQLHACPGKPYRAEIRGACQRGWTLRVDEFEDGTHDVTKVDIRWCPFCGTELQMPGAAGATTAEAVLSQAQVDELEQRFYRLDAPCAPNCAAYNEEGTSYDETKCNCYRSWMRRLLDEFKVRRMPTSGTPEGNQRDVVEAAQQQVVAVMRTAVRGMSWPALEDALRLIGLTWTWDDYVSIIRGARAVTLPELARFLDVCGFALELTCARRASGATTTPATLRYTGLRTTARRAWLRQEVAFLEYLGRSRADVSAPTSVFGTVLYGEAQDELIMAARELGHLLSTDPPATESAAQTHDEATKAIRLFDAAARRYVRMIDTKETL